jgi:ABC-type glycerol-3-phosphate transport system substrate-binding protein
MRKHLLTTTAAMLLAMTGVAFADMEAAKKFLDAEVGDMSALDRAGQEAEMQWFIDAAKPFAGMEIKVVSETITTHEYESKVLAPAFTAITGIKITHDLIGEGRCEYLSTRSINLSHQATAERFNVCRVDIDEIKRTVDNHVSDLFNQAASVGSYYLILSVV